MAEPDDIVEVGLRVVTNDAGDTIGVGLEDGKIHLEVANPGREPIEVWLSPDEARAVIELLLAATGDTARPAG